MVATSLNNLAALYYAQRECGSRQCAYLARGLEIEEQHLDLNLALLTDTRRQAYVATSQAPPMPRFH
jgi:hypothetical protein